MNRATERLLAVAFGLACGGVIALIAWLALRTAPEVPRQVVVYGPPARLKGQVVDGGVGIPSAEVCLFADQLPLEAGGHDLAHLAGAGTQYGWSVRTGADGRFDVEVLDPRALFARAKVPGGGITPPVRVLLASGQEQELEIPATGRRAHGRIVDAVTGEAVADATLEFTWMQNRYGRAPLQADAGGDFALACLPDDDELLVEATGHVARLYKPSREGVADTDAWIVDLAPEAVIEGVLLGRDGQPLNEPMGVLVFRDDCLPQPSGQELLYAESEGGRFRIGGIAAGAQRVAMTPRLEGDLCWTIQCMANAILIEKRLDLAVGQTVEVSLQMP